MIDHKLPDNWRDLQEKVAEIFRDIGFKTETEFKIKTVRGTVEIDVYALDGIQSPKIEYLCECKYWERNVPQSIVHSFRTVVHDYGANFGIIISKMGFQNGAYEAVRNTNINLVDWYGFQNMFEEKWFLAITDKLNDKHNDLAPYTEPLIGAALGQKLDQLSQEGVDKFLELRQKYRKIGTTIVHLKYGRLVNNIKERIKFPLIMQIPIDVEINIELYSLRDLINFLDFWAERALIEIEEVFKIYIQ